MTDEKTQEKSQKRKWFYGLGFFWLIVIGVNLYFVYSATSGDRPLVEDHTYDKSLKYDQRIAHSKSIKADLDTLQIKIDKSQIYLEAKKKDLIFTSKTQRVVLKFYRISDASLDRTTELKWDSAAGVWSGQLPEVKKGYYKIVTQIQLDQNRYSQDFEYFAP
jgi:hypothetical protein